MAKTAYSAKSVVKKHTQLSRTEFSVMRIAKRNLKKQTQFQKSQIEISVLLTRTYRRYV